MIANHRDEIGLADLVTELPPNGLVHSGIASLIDGTPNPAVLFPQDIEEQLAIGDSIETIGSELMNDSSL